MQAVVKVGGKQFMVTEGSTIRVAKRPEEVGAAIDLPDVLLTEDKGALSTDAKVTVKAAILGHGLADKIRVFKHHAKKRYRRTQGHRQAYTDIKIGKIEAKKA